MKNDRLPLKVQIQFGENLDYFDDLIGVVASFRELDVLTAIVTSIAFDPRRRLIRKYPSGKNSHLQADQIIPLSRAQVLKFQVAGPAKLSVTCRPEWLALLVIASGEGWAHFKTPAALSAQAEHETISSLVIGGIDFAPGANHCESMIVSKTSSFVAALMTLSERELLVIHNRLQEIRRHLLPSNIHKITIEEHSPAFRKSSIKVTERGLYSEPDHQLAIGIDTANFVPDAGVLFTSTVP